MESSAERPEIDYPCPWTYRVIVVDVLDARSAIAARLGSRPHRLSDGLTSRTGKYASLELELEVFDEGDRDELFAALSAMAGVRFVL